MTLLMAMVRILRTTELKNYWFRVLSALKYWRHLITSMFYAICSCGRLRFTESITSWKNSWTSIV